MLPPHIFIGMQQHDNAQHGHDISKEGKKAGSDSLTPKDDYHRHTPYSHTHRTDQPFLPAKFYQPLRPAGELHSFAGMVKEKSGQQDYKQQNCVHD